MNLKFFFIAILIVMLANPLMYTQIFSIALAQSSDKSFKGAVAPFIPPPESDRTPKPPPSDGISINDLPSMGIKEREEEDGEEKDKDKLPPLTQREIKELQFDNIAQNMSQDLDTNIGTNETKLISNTTGSENDEDDNIISSSELPNRDILSFINNTKGDTTVTEEAAAAAEEEEEEEEEEEQPAVTDELTTEGERNVTNTETQNNEDDLEDEGKTITIEELPMRSEESQNEGATEGNVTIKGLPKVNNSSNHSDLTTSSELTDEPEQEIQTPSSEETTEEITKKENKIKILEICNDEIDNDLDGIIDEEHECISKPSGIRPTNEKVVPELATLNDKGNDEEEEKNDNQKQNTKDEENNEEQSHEDSKWSNKNNVDDNVFEEKQRSLDPEIRPNGVEIITNEEICNDEIDNDLDGIIDEEHECNNK